MRRHIIFGFWVVVAVFLAIHISECRRKEAQVLAQKKAAPPPPKEEQKIPRTYKVQIVKIDFENLLNQHRVRVTLKNWGTGAVKNAQFILYPYRLSDDDPDIAQAPKDMMHDYAVKLEFGRIEPGHQVERTAMIPLHHALEPANRGASTLTFDPAPEEPAP